MERLYVLISNDLNPVYGCVQGGHAVAQWLLENEKTQTWNNQYLIYLYADTEKWRKMLDIKSVPYTHFRESDLNGKVTAIAVANDGHLFRNLKKVE